MCLHSAGVIPLQHNLLWHLPTSLSFQFSPDILLVSFMFLQMITTHLSRCYTACFKNCNLTGTLYKFSHAIYGLILSEDLLFYFMCMCEFLYVCIYVCMYVNVYYVCASHSCSALRGQRRASNPLELWLKNAVSCHEGARNGIWVLPKSSQLSQTLSYLSQKLF